MNVRKPLSLLMIVTLLWEMFASTAAFAATTSTPTKLNKTATSLGNNEYEVHLTVDKQINRDPYDIVLVFDRTGSMGADYGNSIVTAKEKTKEFVNNVLADNPENRFAVVSFAESATTNVNFGSDASAINTAIDSLEAKGGTNIRSGLNEAIKVMKKSVRPQENRIVILLTDGVATFSDVYDRNNGFEAALNDTDKENIDVSSTYFINEALIGGRLVQDIAQFYSVGLFGGLTKRSSYTNNFAGKKTYGYFWGGSFNNSYLNQTKLAQSGHVDLDALTNRVTSKKATMYNATLKLDSTGKFSPTGTYEFNVQVPIVYNEAKQGDLQPFTPGWWSEDELGRFMLREATPKGDMYDIYKMEDLFKVYQTLAKQIAISSVVEDIVPPEFTLDVDSLKAKYGDKVMDKLVKYDEATRKIMWYPNLRDAEVDHLTYKLKAKDGMYGTLATNNTAILTYSEDLKDSKKEYFPIPEVTIAKPAIAIKETVYTDEARTIPATKVKKGEKVYYKVIVKNDDSMQTFPIRYNSSFPLANASVDGTPTTIAKNTPINLGAMKPKAEKVILGETVATETGSIVHQSDALANVDVMEIQKANNSATNRIVKNEELKVSDTTTVTVGEQTATVTVKYLDEETNKEVLATETYTKAIDEIYNYPPKTVTNYEADDKKGTVYSGKTPAGGVTIVHYYVKTAPMVVQYLLKDTTTAIKPELRETLRVKTKYSYEKTVDILGYQQTSVVGKLSGDVVEGGTTIQVYYSKLAKVTVSYVDKETKQSIKTSFVEEKTVGSDYKHTAPNIDGYAYDSSSNNEVGTVKDGGTNVVFYYNKVVPTAFLNVMYVDKQTGKELAPEKRIAKPVNGTYEESPITITDYTYKDGTGNPKGTVPAAGVTVVFYYEKTKVTTKVRHIDEATKASLVAEETITGEVGTTYTTSAKPISSYTLSATPPNATGKYAVNMPEIVYTYKKVVVIPPTPTPQPIPPQPTPQPVPATGKVTVQFIDVATKQPITSATTKTGTVGTSYETAPVTISEYELVTTPTNAKGAYTQADITVSYEYKKIPYGSVVARYVDEFTRQPIAPEVIVRDVAGKTYETKSVAVKGYQLIRVPTNASGTISGATTNVVYEFKRLKGQVTIKHIDQQTKKELAPAIVFDGYYETTYTTKPEEFAGYKLARSTGTLAGKFSEVNQEIIYYYNPTIVLKPQTVPGGRPDYEEGKVIIRYIDAKTKKAMFKQTTLVKEVGTPYKAVAKVAEGYKLAKVVGKTTGKVATGQTVVTYMYEAKVKAANPEVPQYDNEPTLPVTGEEVPWTTYVVGMTLLALAALLTIRPRRQSH